MSWIHAGVPNDDPSHCVTFLGAVATYSRAIMVDWSGLTSWEDERVVGRRPIRFVLGLVAEDFGLIGGIGPRPVWMCGVAGDERRRALILDLDVW